jgi:hypothetical protein
MSDAILGARVANFRGATDIAAFVQDHPPTDILSNWVRYIIDRHPRERCHTNIDDRFGVLPHLNRERVSNSVLFPPNPDVILAASLVCAFPAKQSMGCPVHEFAIP